jgi:hypothetical protein
LSRRREEIEGGIRRTIDLNRMWRTFGWSTRFNQRMRTCSLHHYCHSLKTLEFINPLLHGTSSELSATQDRATT